MKNPITLRETHKAKTIALKDLQEHYDIVIDSTIDHDEAYQLTQLFVISRFNLVNELELIESLILILEFHE